MSMIPPTAAEPATASAAVKFLVVLGVTFAVTLGTYDLLVRSTWMGAALNGRRYPRALAPARPSG